MPGVLRQLETQTLNYLAIETANLGTKNCDIKLYFTFEEKIIFVLQEKFCLLHNL